MTLGTVQGYPGGIPIYAVMYACFGVAAVALLAGLAASVSAIARPSTPGRRSVAVAVAAGVGAALLVALALAFVPGASLLVAIPVGMAAAAIGLGLARVAERRAVRVPAPAVSPDVRSRRPLAAAAILVGGVLALPLGTGLVTLLRERLHYACSGGAPGTEAAGWVCADGISYLGAGLPPLGVAALVVLAGLLLTLTARDPRPVRPILVLLAVVAVGVGLLGTWLAVVQETREVPPGVVRTDFWVEAVLPAAGAAVLALGVAAAALATRGRTAVMLMGAAAAGILIATVLQPGLALSTMSALGLLLAAALITPMSRRNDGAPGD